ncbi:uncharacterized protein LOC106014018 [Aplysia californica]|uniref:Uncharacterized protein LOC106014018 n=1 Tax=Aplysia californica TaxID=6500 RepID=A0ABM1AF40_APLCA|nr:uncharacterized protein LOC106014018 [Aplysia californica]
MNQQPPTCVSIDQLCGDKKKLKAPHFINPCGCDSYLVLEYCEALNRNTTTLKKISCGKGTTFRQKSGNCEDPKKREEEICRRQPWERCKATDDQDFAKICDFPDPDDSNSIHAGAIVGGVLAGLIVLALIVAAVIYAKRKGLIGKKKDSSRAEVRTEAPHNGPGSYHNDGYYTIDDAAVAAANTKVSKVPANTNKNDVKLSENEYSAISEVPERAIQTEPDYGYAVAKRVSDGYSHLAGNATNTSTSPVDYNSAPRDPPLTETNPNNDAEAPRSDTEPANTGNGDYLVMQGEPEYSNAKT